VWNATTHLSGGISSYSFCPNLQPVEALISQVHQPFLTRVVPENWPMMPEPVVQTQYPPGLDEVIDPVKFMLSPFTVDTHIAAISWGSSNTSLGN
jgi:hypothetical protein